ncbi:site-specific recombinase Gcr [Vaginella massiliensis]|uniref:site-specific recombinase Gcr n=1 Tax=Vaginella massiliensis TaxID=1816680 RepID=UPI003750113C
MNLEGLLTLSQVYDKSFIIKSLKYARKKYPNAIDFIDDLINKLNRDQSFRQEFLTIFGSIFGNINFMSYLADSGITLADGSFGVFTKRITDLILPQIENNNELTSLINEIFYDQKNYNFIKIIPKDRWLRFYQALYQDFSEDALKEMYSAIQSQMLQAISILNDRITGGFSDRDLLRYSTEVNYLDNPISKLSLRINRIVDRHEVSYDVLELKKLIVDCRTLLENILLQKDFKGISLRVATRLNTMQQQLARLQRLLNMYNTLNAAGVIEFNAQASKSWVDFYSPTNYVRNQLSSTIYLITFLATYHNGKTGEKYITSTAKEYVKMFSTALGGGFIVSFLCFIKVSIGNVEDASPLFQGFFYSLNYAIGFCAIYLLHWTLATKQPSMTAARLSQAIKPKEGNEVDVKAFTTLFAQLSRSQLIAFLGNVIAGFVVSLGLFYLINDLLNIKFIKYSKAYKFWEELVIMDKLIFWYASIAGVFLFISGLISGLTINYQRFNNIPERIYNHPVLKSIFSMSSRRRIANWFQLNMGGVVGNIVFGFMMGCAFLVGEFTGFPFDIRHITFAAGNLAIGVGGMGYHFDIAPLIIAFVSVFLIGGFNFFVSFTLSLLLAMRSNNIPFTNIFPLIGQVIKAFFRNPFPFFIPPLWTKNKQEA